MEVKDKILEVQKVKDELQEFFEDQLNGMEIIEEMSLALIYLWTEKI